MIYLFDENHKKIGSFDTYSDFVDYINRKEIKKAKKRLLSFIDDEYDCVDDDRWGVYCYKHSHLEMTYDCMKNPPLTEVEWHASCQGVDLIEIYTGDDDNPVQIARTGDVDLEEIMRRFCLAYSKAHNFLIVETDSYVSNVYG